MSGERYFWTARTPRCAPVSASTYKETTFGALAANRQARWPRGGYKARDTSADVGAVVHEYQWTVHDYPGDWWLVVKSVHFDKRKGDLGYRYAPSDHLCEDPTVPGYTA
jgi:hypothetical protein